MVKKQEEIIEHNGRKLKVIEVIEEGKSQQEIDFEQWTDEKYCIKAVEKNGYALRYVKSKKTFLKIHKGGESADSSQS